MEDFLVGGHVVARALRNEGVGTVYTLCGGHVMPIYDGCLREGIAIVDMRHAQAAVHAADAHARLTRTPGVAVLSAGSGITDGVTAVAGARRAEVPLVVIGGALEQRGAGRMAHPDEGPMALKAVAKWSATVTLPARLPEVVATAFRVARSGVPGPVFLELPLDVLAAQVRSPHFPERSRFLSRTQLDPDGVAAAEQILDGAERPIVLAGSQVWWDEAAESLRALVDRHGLPTFLLGMARGALPSSHPLSFSLSREHAMGRADCVLLLGAPDDRASFGATMGPAARLIHFDRDPLRLGEMRAEAVGIAGDVRSNIEALDRALTAPPAGAFGAWLDELRTTENAARSAIQRFALDDGRPANHYRFGRAIAEAIDRDTILVADGGDVVDCALKMIPLEAPGLVLDAGPLATTGVGPPYALAARLLHPERKVLIVAGDGAFGAGGIELESCIRHKLPVVCIVGNDAAWGRVRTPQIMLYGEERAPATKLSSTRYDRVIEALGGRGEHVEDPREITAALKRGFASQHTYCIDVALEPNFMLRSGAARISE